MLFCKYLFINELQRRFTDAMSAARLDKYPITRLGNDSHIFKRSDGAYQLVAVTEKGIIRPTRNLYDSPFSWRQMY